MTEPQTTTARPSDIGHCKTCGETRRFVDGRCYYAIEAEKLNAPILERWRNAGVADFERFDEMLRRGPRL
jgi:hypothetical protein